MNSIGVFLWTLATCVLHLEISPAQSAEPSPNGAPATFKMPENLKKLHYKPYFRNIAVDVGTGSVYIGADNWIFQLDANLSLVDSAETSANSSFYTECYSAEDCQENGVEGMYRNTVLVVNRDFNELITCGFVHSPGYFLPDTSDCAAWNLMNFIQYERNISAIIGDDPYPIAFVAPGISKHRTTSNVLYVASSPTTSSSKRVAKISSHKIDPAANLELTFPTDQYQLELEYGRYYNFRYGFSSGGFSYFLAKDNRDESGRLFRVCQNASENRSYADIPIQCLDTTGKPYKRISTAYLVHPGNVLAQDLNITVGEDALLVLFNRPWASKGVLCIFSMQTIRETFRRNIQQFSVSRMHLMEMDREFCNWRFRTLFRGNIAVETVATKVFEDTQVHGVVSTTRGVATVVFIETLDRLEKFLILGSSTAVSYYSKRYFRGSESRFSFDSHEQNLYLMTEDTVYRLPVHDCSDLKTRDDCIQTVDPLCGWCTAQNRCTSEDLCFKNGRKESSSSDNEGWTTCRIQSKQQLQVTTGESILVDSPIAEHVKIPTDMEYSAICFKRVNCTFSNASWKETLVGKPLRHGVLKCPMPKTPLATCSRTLQLKITIDKTGLISKLTHQRNVTFFDCSHCESEDKCLEHSCTWNEVSQQCSSAFHQDPVNCHSHLERCHFTKIIEYGGVWQCQDNTGGYKCDRCKPTFYLHPKRNITDKDACWPCNCDLAGSLPNTTCDSKTDAEKNLEAGKCYCKTFVTGRGCDECQIGYWNLNASNPNGCQVPPTILPFNFTKDPVYAGGSTQATCFISLGDTPINISWTFQGRPLMSDPGIKTRKIDHRTSVLLVEPVVPGNRGKYTCTARNAAGIANHSAALQVNVSLSWIVEPTDMSFAQGSDVRIECKADGSPEPTVTWKKAAGDGPVNFRNLKGSETGVRVEDGTLIISAIPKRAEGRYMCEATNEIEVGLSAVINIYVQAPPKLKIKRGKQTVKRGKSAILQCGAVGEKPIKILWNKNGMLLDPKSDPRYTIQEEISGNSVMSKLSVKSVERNDSVNFTCVATNAIGSDRRNIFLIVQEPPYIPKDLEVLNNTATSVQLVWRKPSNGRSPITRFFIEYKKAEGDWITAEDRLQIPGSQTSAEVHNLSPATTYHLRLIAENAIGTSEASPAVTFTTAEKAPTGPPQNISCTTLTSQSIRVSWTSSPLASANGVIRGYKVTYGTASTWHDPTTKETKVTTASEKILDRLKKYTKYNITILAHTNGGEGVESIPISCQTEQDVPEAPQSVKAIVMPRDAILISWQPPKFPNGVIIGYTVYYRTVEEDVVSQPDPVSQKTSASQTTFEVSSLSRSEHSEYWVTAHTAVGEGAPSKSVTVAPTNKVPAKIASVAQTIVATHRENVKLPCQAVGFPEPRIQWTVKGSALTQSDRLRLLPDGSLQIKEVTRKDAGNYSCRAENSNGYDTTVHSLVVQAQPPSISLAKTTENTITVRLMATTGSAPRHGMTLSYKKDSGDWVESPDTSRVPNGDSILRFHPGEPVLLNCDVAPQIPATEEVRYVVETVNGTSVIIETFSIQASRQVVAFLDETHNGGKLGCRAEVEVEKREYKSTFVKLELITSDLTEEVIFDLESQLYVWCNDSKICSLQTKDDILDFAMDASSNVLAIRMNPPEIKVYKNGNVTQKPGVVELPETISTRTSELKSAVIGVDPWKSQVIWTHSPGGHLWLTNVETGTSLPLKKDFGVVQMDVDWKEQVVFGVSEKDRKCIFKLDLKNTSSVVSICVNEAITSIAVGHEHIYYVTESGKIFQRNPKTGSEIEVFKGHQNSNVVPRNLVAHKDGNVSWIQDFFGKISVIYILQPPKSSSEKPRRSRYVFKGLIRGIGPTKMADDSSSCPKCSHFCNPGSRTSCICPWKLEIQNETQCTGKWIHVASANASTKSQTDLLTYDFSKTRENRHPVVLNSSRVELMPQSNFGESRCFIQVNEAGSTELVFHNTTTDLIIGFDSILQVLPSSNPLDVDVIFFNNSCIRILHTKNNETWTLFCGQVNPANVVIDAKSWIVFWEHETDKSVHMTKLPSLVTRKIIEAKDFETAKKAQGRLALDSNSKVLYWIHGKKIWSLNYEKTDSSKMTSLWTCTTTPKQIQFHDEFLYWTETEDGENDKIVIFDLEFGSKQTLISSPGGQFKSFAVQSGSFDLPDGPIQCEECSHFCKESTPMKIPENCWCPNEKPILALNGTCHEPILHIVQATENQNILNVTNTRSHENVIRQISTEATAGTKVFASNRNVECWLQGPQNEVICSFLTPDGNETKSVLGSAHTTNPLLSLSSTNNFVIFNTGNETGKYASLILANTTNGEKLEFEAIKEDQRNPFAFDHRRKLAVWCTDRGRELKFHEVGGSHLDSHEVSIETDFCDRKAKSCTSLALDEENSRAYFIYGNQIKRLDYFPKSSNPPLRTLHEFRYSRANSLSFDGNGNLFWAGGFADFGEFVDMIKVPENPGEMVASVRVFDNKKRTIVQVEAERNFVNATKESSLNDTCSSHDCKHFCFPGNRWTLEGAKCYCPTEIPPDGAKSSKCEPPYKKKIHTEGETITKTVENENEKDDSLLKILIGACSGVVVLGLIIFGLIIRKRRGNQQEDYKKALTLFLDGDQDSANMIGNPAERSYYVPFSKVIPPEDINLNDAKQLGSGQFGAVFLAKYKEEPVAIKVVKHGSDKEQMKEFLKEIKIMAYIGEHAHIVQMYGAEVSNLEKGGVLVVLELCPHGDLETFLRKHRNNFNSANAAAGTSKNEVTILAEDDQISLNFSNLVDWSRQIAHGLAYLEEKQVVHGDLATRNALLFDNNVVKVSDFGFSRKTYGKQYTKANKQTPLPFRWAAPETLDQMTFSTQTDVWSYGVTVWEIFTLGNCPFAQQSWDLTFSTRLREGMRLEKPELATDEMYDRLMMHCWKINPDDRPTFLQVCEFWNEFCNYNPVNLKNQEKVRYVIT